MSNEVITPEFISKLRTASSKLMTTNNNGLGVSDPDELVNQIVMRILEGKQSLPSDPKNISYKALAYKALEQLTGGTSPANRKSGNTMPTYSHGLLCQSEDESTPTTLVWDEYDDDYFCDAELKKLLGTMLCVMSEENYELLVKFIKCGSATKLAEQLEIDRKSLWRKLKKARIEFLELIPADTKLATAAMSLFREYGVDEPTEGRLIDNGTQFDGETRAAILRLEEGLEDEKRKRADDRPIKRCDEFTVEDLHNPKGKKYRLEFDTIKQYVGEHFFKTREDATRMMETMTDKSIIRFQLYYIPENKLVEEFINHSAGKVLIKTKAVEPSWVNTIDGMSPADAVDYSNYED